MALSKATRFMVERAFENISTPPRPTEPPWLHNAWAQMDREFVTGPPLTLHLPVPALFATFWAALRESFLAGPTDRVLREVIASAVSTANECAYCVDSHTAAASAFGEDHTAKALRSGALGSIRDAGLRAAAEWGAATRRRGDPILADSPFDPRDEPYALGTALLFHYLNRMVSAFLKPTTVKIPAFVNRRPLMTRANALLAGRMLAVPNLEAGASLEFCPSAPSVPTLSKLEKAREVTTAWASFVASAEEAGRSVLSDAPRRAVTEAINDWDGSDPGLGTAWTKDALATLRPDEQPAASFALTCALASYRVDRRLVDAVRRTHPTDASLVAIAAWASVHAVLRIASWL